MLCLAETSFEAKRRAASQMSDYVMTVWNTISAVEKVVDYSTEKIFVKHGNELTQQHFITIALEIVYEYN